MEGIPLFTIAIVLSLAGVQLQFIKDELKEANRLKRIEIQEKRDSSLQSENLLRNHTVTGVK